jgi:ubiquinone/menaquinone biosynthesis C-methylase UbiE
MQIEKYKHTFWYTSLVNLTNKLLLGKGFKSRVEFLYWNLKKMREGEFNNNHYEAFYTAHFQLDLSFYTNKKILDIGCGPRGSLEWAAETNDCYGLDPLANKYLGLGADKHRMRYIQGVSESIPFANEYFDVVASFNSLDHVDDVEASIKEIARVLKPAGKFLLITDIHESPTITEPSAFSWDIVKSFKKDFEILGEQHFEGHEMYKSIRKAIPFDHLNTAKRYGILSVLFSKL